MMYNRWLAHHGRLGQKWGEKNGPPYPLYRQKRFSAKGKKLSDSAYLKETAKNYRHDKQTPGLTTAKDGQRWMLSRVTADFSSRPKTSVVKKRTVKDYKWIKDIQQADQYMRNRRAGQNILADAKILKTNVLRMMDKAKNGLPVKRRETSREQDLKAINPSYKTETASGSNNCLLCTVAYDMRRRGYDVMARQRAPIEYLWDINTPDFSYLYEGSKVVGGKSLNSVVSKISNQNGGNSRGALMATWDGYTSGHCVAYQVDDGRVTLYDGQDGNIYTNPDDLFTHAHNFKAVRLDNVEPNYSLVRLAIE